ncbi:hypothetical protein [Streptacidiphilus sp. EB129]|uniref:hypothetical protein n=1 Tax=Streptacidiphilus sp. EB129 TaxID=3156262 RepID=UPI003512F14F
MATAQISSQAVAPIRARGATPSSTAVPRQTAPTTHGSTGSGAADRSSHLGPLRTALRGAGVFLDTTLRVVLLGGDGLDRHR